MTDIQQRQRAGAPDARLAELLTPPAGLVALAARHVESGRAWHHNERIALPSASLIKLPILAAFWDAVKAGRVDPARRVAVPAAEAVQGTAAGDVSLRRLFDAAVSRLYAGYGSERTGRGTMAVEVATRRRFTRAEYSRMCEAGIFGEDDRVELIRGEIIEMPAPGRRHRAFAGNLNQLLVTRLAGRAIVWMQNPIVLSGDSEPQPDLAVLRHRAVPYKEREAWGEDVLLLIEVADSSLVYDRSIKLALYAEAGIPEYWVVDCAAETVEVYRRPGAEGYGEFTRLSGTATLTLQAFPDVALTLREVFA